MSRRSTTKQWVRKQANDPYVKQRDAAGLRSRAAFKLKEIFERDRLIQKGAYVVDLGASPGGWSQIAAQRVGAAGKVIAVDILAMEPLVGVQFIEGDAREPETIDKIREYFADRRADLVISDIAPNITGIRDLDEANFLELADSVKGIAIELLAKNGSMVIKLFQFPGTDTYVRDLKQMFSSVTRRKPDSSRKASREFYVVAKGFDI